MHPLPVTWTLTREESRRTCWKHSQGHLSDIVSRSSSASLPRFPLVRPLPGGLRGDLLEGCCGTCLIAWREGGFLHVREALTV